jgi:hypothetical protein
MLCESSKSYDYVERALSLSKARLLIMNAVGERLYGRLYHYVKGVVDVTHHTCSGTPAAASRFSFTPYTHENRYSRIAHTQNDLTRLRHTTRDAAPHQCG